VTAFLDALKVGDRVVTTGGIYGQVTRLGDQSVQIQSPTRSGSSRESGDRRLSRPGAVVTSEQSA